MFYNRASAGTIVPAAATILLLLLVSGCDGPGGAGTSGGTTRVTVVLSGQDSVVTRETAGVSGVTSGTRAVVPFTDIESLIVTITAIVLERGGEDASEATLTKDLSDTGSGSIDTSAVLLDGASFHPTSLTVVEGESVRWSWIDDATHTVTSGLAGDADAGLLFDSGELGPGAVYEVFFLEAGLYPYHSDTDSDIDSGMSGLIEVIASGDASTLWSREDVSQARAASKVEIDLLGETIVVDLTLLTNLSQFMSTATIPAGEYRGMVLTIQDPVLSIRSDSPFFTSDPQVQLTANGRLFVRKGFELIADGAQLIELQLGGIHLVEGGAGGQFVFTPQLSMTVDALEADAQWDGTISAIDPPSQTIIVGSGTQDVTVIITDDTVIQPLDQSARGFLSYEHFALGQHVIVEGPVAPDGTIVADRVFVALADLGQVEVRGEIVSIDEVEQTLVIENMGAQLQVIVTADTFISVPRVTALSFADLEIGQTVDVLGTFESETAITALGIEILVGL